MEFSVEMFGDADGEDEGGDGSGGVTAVLFCAVEEGLLSRDCWRKAMFVSSMFVLGLLSMIFSMNRMFNVVGAFCEKLGNELYEGCNLKTEKNARGTIVDKIAMKICCEIPRFRHSFICVVSLNIIIRANPKKNHRLL